MIKGSQAANHKLVYRTMLNVMNDPVNGCLSVDKALGEALRILGISREEWKLSAKQLLEEGE